MRSLPYRARRAARTVLMLVTTVSLSFSIARAAGIKTADPDAASSRPISDFLLAQGSTNFFIPPLPDFIAWTDNAPLTMFASVDYAGVVAAYLLSHGGPNVGTEMAGTVSERPLPDGRADVNVTLHTKNAVTWIIPLPASDLATDPLLYGARGTELLANPSLVPTLSRCEMRVNFTNTAMGAPLPDLIAFILGTNDPAQELRAVMVNATGGGTMHAAAGVPEGTPGRFTLINNGVFHASFKGGTADGFPAEQIVLRPAGSSIVSESYQFENPTAAAASPAVKRSSWARVKALFR